MTPTHKQKLQDILAELYEAGDSPEDIVEVITDDMTSSDQIVLIEDILTGVKDKDQVNEFLVEGVKDLIQHKNYDAIALLEEYEINDVLKVVSESDNLEDFIVNQLGNDDDLKESVLFSIGANINIPSKLLTMDKQYRIENFIKQLFPYYNEQSQIQMNF
jgi:hypothetical protein